MVFVTHYDPTTKSFTFVDEDFDLIAIAKELEKIQQMADSWVQKKQLLDRAE
jgi:hypothetical protein